MLQTSFNSSCSNQICPESHLTFKSKSNELPIVGEHTQKDSKQLFWIVWDTGERTTILPTNPDVVTRNTNRTTEDLPYTIRLNATSYKTVCSYHGYWWSFYLCIKFGETVMFKSWIVYFTPEAEFGNKVSCSTVWSGKFWQYNKFKWPVGTITQSVVLFCHGLFLCNPIVFMRCLTRGGNESRDERYSL